MEGNERIDDARRSREWLDVLSDHERALWGALALALLADAVLTWYGLRQGLAEANPVMATAMAWLGAAGGILVVKAGAVAVAAAARVSVAAERGPVVPLAMSLPWALAAMVNAVGILTL